MSKKNHIYIEGIDEVADFLEKEVPEQAQNLLRAVVGSLATEIAKEVRKNIEAAGLVDEGSFKKSIKARRGRLRDGLRPHADVIGDFYWFHHEYGTQNKNKLPETPILRPATDKVEANMDDLLERKVMQRIRALTKRLRKKRVGS